MSAVLCCAVLCCAVQDTFRAGFSMANKSEAYYQVPQPLSIPLYTPSRQVSMLALEAGAAHSLGMLPWRKPPAAHDAA